MFFMLLACCFNIYSVIYDNNYESDDDFDDDDTVSTHSGNNQ
jgi:hypothetical protein